MFSPAGIVDHQVSASGQTPSGMCIGGLFYGALHDQILEPPADSKKITSWWITEVSYIWASKEKCQLNVC